MPSKLEAANSLDAAQQKQAILNYQVSDLVLGPTQEGKTIQPEGIKVSALNAAQREMLLNLAREVRMIFFLNVDCVLVEYWCVDAGAI